MLENKFSDFLLYRKRASLHTIEAYLSDIIQFKEWFLSQGNKSLEWNNISNQDIRAYVIFLSNNNYSNTSTKRKMSSLNSFFKFCVKNNLVESNPVKLIVAPKTIKKLPVFLTENQSLEMLSYPVNTQSFSEVRSYLIVELLYSTGIRRDELINIKENDINFSNGQIIVMGKRRKERIIPLLNPITNTLKNYLQLREKIDVETDNLILTDSGKKLYPMFVYRVVNTYIRSVSTASKKSPHVLRHSFATQMLNNGADINAIKELLGHESLAATQIYTHNSIAELKKVFNQAHPHSSQNN